MYQLFARLRAFWYRLRYRWHRYQHMKTVLYGGAMGGTLATIPPPLPPPRPRGSCHVNGPLPDKDATPGAYNDAVTEATIPDTIGRGGWTATIRPLVTYTNALKAQQMVEYNLPGSMSDYEEDHLVPLCVGGSPTSYQNLWPQKREGDFGAGVKDRCEVLAQHAILSGQMSLDEVRRGFSESWVDLHTRLTRTAALSGLMAAIPQPEPEP